MANKKVLWTCGDSFTEGFPGMLNGKLHPEFKNPTSPYEKYVLEYSQKENLASYTELVSEALEMDLVNSGFGGSSNDAIFHQFVGVMEKISPEDLVIVGWSDNSRYRLADKNNRLFSILLTGLEIDILDNVSMNTLKEIFFNRSATAYHQDVINYIKVIDTYCKSIGANTLHWSWLDQSYGQKRLGTDAITLELMNLLMPYKKRSTISEETENKIQDFHYGKIGHEQLAQDIIDYIKSDR